VNRWQSGPVGLRSTPHASEQVARSSDGALNAFNLIAVPSRSRLARRFPRPARLVATHPPLQVRLDALEALERAQQRPGA
jgi:Zn-dependent protease with chaperone function